MREGFFSSSVPRGSLILVRWPSKRTASLPYSPVEMVEYISAAIGNPPSGKGSGPRMNKRDIPDRASQAALNGKPAKRRNRKSEKEAKAPSRPAVPPRSSASVFRHSASLDELARMQGVKPLADFDEIKGTWPGDIDDGFEEAVAALRAVGMSGAKCQRS